MGVVDRIPDKIVEARARMMVRAVFFTVILYDQCKLYVVDNGEWSGTACPTALTDGKNIVMDQKFMEGLTLDERVFVFCHEVYHVMAMHPKRMRSYRVNGLFGYTFNATLYNYLADAIINKCLIDSKIGTMPKLGVDHAAVSKQLGYTILGTETPEELYERWLKKFPPKSGGSPTTGGGSSGRGSGDKSDPLAGDCLLDTPDASAHDINEAELRAAIKSALEQATAQGTVPVGASRLIGEILEPVVDWKEELREYVTRIAYGGADASDWRRANKRKLVAPGTILPRRMGVKMGIVGIAVDTSGSVSQRMLQQFMGEVASILGDTNPHKIMLMWCDAAVDGIDEYDEPEELKQFVLKKGAIGGGGTSFIPPFKYLQEKDIDVDVFIYLTDGYGPFPTDDQVTSPVIWCICSDDVVSPQGTTIKINVR